MNIAPYEVSVVATSDKHYEDIGVRKRPKDDVAGSFSDMFKSSIGKVNDLQVESDKMTQKMIYEPESVDIHNVMIAGQKASVALHFTKAVRDEAVKAYRELMQMR